MKGHRTRLTVIIGAVAILALALVSWLLILSPRMSQASEVKQQADQLAGANLGLRNEYNRGITMAKDAPAAAAQAQALFATMPEQAQLPEVIEQIMGAAVDAGIAAKQVEMISTSVPSPVNPRDARAAAGAADAVKAGVNLATMQVDISAAGTGPQILKFLDNLQALDRALLITSTQLTINQAAAVDQAKVAAQSVQIGGTMFVLESSLPDLVKSVATLMPKGVGASPSATASPAAAPSAGTPASTDSSPGATPGAAPDASSTPVPLQP